MHLARGVSTDHANPPTGRADSRPRLLLLRRVRTVVRSATVGGEAPGVGASPLSSVLLPAVRNDHVHDPYATAVAWAVGDRAVSVWLEDSGEGGGDLLQLLGG